MTIKTRTSSKAAAKPVKKVAAKPVKKVAAKPVATKTVATKKVASKKITTREEVMKLEAEQVSEAQSQGQAVPQNDQPITGRGVFAVRTLGDAVSVEAAFLAEDGNVLRLPAVFPNREYALQQIDELRQIVNKHFDDLGK